MIRLTTLVLAALMATLPRLADAQQALLDPAMASPTAASVDQLLAIQRIPQLLDDTRSEVVGSFQSIADGELAKRIMSPDGRRLVEAAIEKNVRSLNDAFAWDRIRTNFLAAYQRSFKQGEIDEITAFYRTPAGQAVINKMGKANAEAVQFVRVDLEKRARTAMSRMESVFREAEQLK